MAKEYNQKGIDVESLFFDYGSDIAPQYTFKNFFKTENEELKPLGPFSYKSDVDSDNKGIGTEKNLYAEHGSPDEFIKSGCFPRWRNAIQITEPGIYTLTYDNDSIESSLILKKQKEENSIQPTYEDLRTFTAEDFQDRSLPESLIVEIQGAGGSGGVGPDSSLQSQGGSAGGSVGGSSGGYCQAVIPLKSNNEWFSSFSLEVGKGGNGLPAELLMNADRDGENGGYSRIAIYWRNKKKIIIKAPGGKGGKQANYIYDNNTMNWKIKDTDIPISSDGDRITYGEEYGEDTSKNLLKIFCEIPCSLGGYVKSSDGTINNGGIINGRKSSSYSDIYIFEDIKYQNSSVKETAMLLSEITKKVNGGNTIAFRNGAMHSYTGGGACAAFGSGGDGMYPGHNIAGDGSMGSGGGGYGYTSSDTSSITKGSGKGGDGFIRLWAAFKDADPDPLSDNKIYSYPKKY